MTEGWPYAQEREIRILKRIEELRSAPAVGGGAYVGATVFSATPDEYEATLRQAAADEVDGEMQWALFAPRPRMNLPSTDVMLATLRYEQTWRFRLWCRLARLRTRLRDTYRVAIGRSRIREA